MPSWDLLICSLAHRHRVLCELLEELDRQWIPGLGVILFHDNMEASVPRKRQELLRASQADYVSFLDDDDWIMPDFTKRIMSALESQPDYIGFQVKITYDGEPQKPCFHSLSYGRWYEWQDRLERDITHLNPIRRRIALLARWEETHDRGWAEDKRYADQIRASRQCCSEIMIHEPMYHYRRSSYDNFQVLRLPLPKDELLPLPQYPWLKVIG